MDCFGKLLAGSLQSLVFSARARSLVCFESRKLTELSGCVITYSVPVLSVEACCKCGGGDILLFVVPIIRVNIEIRVFPNIDQNSYTDLPHHFV